MLHYMINIMHTFAYDKQQCTIARLSLDRFCKMLMLLLQLYCHRVLSACRLTHESTMHKRAFIIRSVLQNVNAITLSLLPQSTECNAMINILHIIAYVKHECTKCLYLDIHIPQC